MKRYTFRCFPTQEDYVTTVEAESKEDAIRLVQEELDYNCTWVALEKDIEKEEEIKKANKK